MNFHSIKCIKNKTINEKKFNNSIAFDLLSTKALVHSFDNYFKV